tara:strand:+ start:8532 stop:9701 length:1170 start_codon:yes stop_codon:yes gene_type:complete
MHSIYRKKNVATTIYLYLGDSRTYYSGFEPRTSRSPSCYVSIDGGTPTNGYSTVTELDGTNMPGVYKVALTADAVNGDIMVANLLDAAGYRSLPMTIYTDYSNTPSYAPTSGFESKIDAIDDFIDTEVAAILVDTGTTLNNKLDTIDGIVDSILVDTGTTLDGKLDTIDNFLDTEVAAILEDTSTTLQANHTAIETIVASNATVVASNATKLDAIDNFVDTEVAAIKTAVDAILVDTGATLNDKIDVIDGIVDSILTDTGTTLSSKIDVIDGIVDNILVDTAALAEPVDCNVTQVSGSSTAADNMELSALSMIVGTSHNSPTPTTTTFASDTGALSSVNDFYKGRIIVFTSGSLTGQVRTILDYTGATKLFTCDAFTTAPPNDSNFIIL